MDAAGQIEWTRARKIPTFADGYLTGRADEAKTRIGKTNKWITMRDTEIIRLRAELAEAKKQRDDFEAGLDRKIDIKEIADVGALEVYCDMVLTGQKPLAGLPERVLPAQVLEPGPDVKRGHVLSS